MSETTDGVERTAELVRLLDIETLDVDLHRGSQPVTRRKRVYGGQVAAQALIAALRSVDEGYQVHSLHSYFLLAGDYGVPIIYAVERIRDGRSFLTRRVEARQHGRVIFYLTASFQRSEEGFEHQDTMPDVPPADQCPDLAELLGKVSTRAESSWRQEWSALDVHYAGDTRPDGGLLPRSLPTRIASPAAPDRAWRRPGTCRARRAPATA